MTRVLLRVRAIFRVIGDICWRSFGLLGMYLPLGLGAGSAVSMFTQRVSDALIGGVVAWLTAVLRAFAEIGKEIALTAKVTNASIVRGFAMAVERAEQALAQSDEEK